MSHLTGEQARRLGMAIAVGVALHAASAFACETDSECDTGQICSNGACIAPNSGPACTRDIECGPEQVCQDHHCVQKMPVFPGEEAPPPAQEPPPPKEPAAVPPPTYGFPPGPSTEAPPGPPPTTPPPGYPRRPPVKFTKHLSFDVFAGGALFMVQTNNFNNLQGFYGAFSGEAALAYHIAPNIALALRAGTIVAPITDLPQNPVFSQFYVGAGMMFPWSHWGFILGVTNATNLNTLSGQPFGRTTGFEIMLPYEYPIARWLKFTINAGLGIYSGMITQTIHFQVGF